MMASEHAVDDELRRAKPRNRAPLADYFTSPAGRAALRAWADELHATLDDLREWSGAKRPNRYL